MSRDQGRTATEKKRRVRYSIQNIRSWMQTAIQQVGLVELMKKEANEADELSIKM